MKTKLGLLPLVAATFFMVSGGPYGIEGLVQQSGYAGAIAILLLIPLIWALPTGLMVGELAAAIPSEGGFYVWVRRALGPFWGFQEAWLSLAASVFDMALYPLFFVAYLGYIGKYSRWLFSAEDFRGAPGLLIGIAMIVVCAAVNLLTPRNLG